MYVGTASYAMLTCVANSNFDGCHRCGFRPMSLGSTRRRRAIGQSCDLKTS